MNNADQYQEETRRFAIYPQKEAIAYLGLGLASEAGEVAGKLKKSIRDDHFELEELVSEVGDVLWYCARLLDEVGVPLSSALESNIAKLDKRKANNTIRGSGDVR